MGEAKRRKLLDPNYGKPVYRELTITDRINGTHKKISITDGIILGNFRHTGKNELLEINIRGENCTTDEFEFMAFLLDNYTHEMLKFFNYEAVPYRVKVNISEFTKTSFGTIMIYPLKWDSPYDSTKVKDFREFKFKLEPDVNRSPSPSPSSSPHSGQRNSPREHTRKAHSRRVACGKGRTERRWVDIAETIVGAN